MEENSKYKAIDLGLSVKWANMNVGAFSETDYGDYFAWGETEPYYVNWIDRTKNPTQWKEGKSAGYANASYTLGQDIYDSNLILKPEYDVAHVKMGGNWRMPTLEQIKELLTLENEWVENYNGTGVNGRLFHGKYSGEGNILFIPASGIMTTGSLWYINSCEYLWSSSDYKYTKCFSHHLGFSNHSIDVFGIRRCYGLTIRGIYK